MEVMVTRNDGWKGALVALAIWVVASPSPAQEIAGYRNDVYAADPREMAKVPGYCAYTLLFRDATPGTNKLEMFNAWKEKVGDSFIHMHHYCAGLIKANRALLLARDRATRQFYLNDAIIEYDYVITRVPDTYILLPEILTKKGEVLLQLDRGPVGVYHFERAIELKPDYWPPYAQLADYYQKSGDLRQARQILEAGLAKMPEAQPLVRRIEGLGNKP
jgi:tetratricopeptide (TPR) repeat protein